MTHRRGKDEQVWSDDLALDVTDVGFERPERGVERAALDTPHENLRLVLNPGNGQARVGLA